MFKNKKVIAILFLAILFSPIISSAQVPDDLQKQVEKYSQKIVELSKAKDTLSNQISYINSQVILTGLKIKQTQQSIISLEKEIQVLTEHIDKLDKNLNQLSLIYIENVSENYKIKKKTPPLIFVLTKKLNQFVDEYKYLKTVQQNNQNLLVELETARTNFDLQKQQKALKQDELTILNSKLSKQQADLEVQKTAKASLLEVTKNDEKKYQQLKAAAEAELKALINARLDKVVAVKKGEILGIMGNTGYSFGAHLHFGLYELKESDVNKFIYENDIDPIGYLNQHQWPMKDYTFTQNRGVTQYSYLYRDRFHHGIDLISPNRFIYAVNDGMAYYYKDRYPNQRVGSGNHVKLFHSDGKMTLYLHME